MRREESPFEFLDGIEKLSSTPIHYLPGYKMLPGYVAPVVETEPEPEVEPIRTLEEERQLLKTDPHNFVRSKIKEQVQDVVWLDMLKENLREMEEKRRATEAEDRVQAQDDELQQAYAQITAAQAQIEELDEQLLYYSCMRSERVDTYA